MKYHPLPFPQERDQVIAEIILDGALSTAEIKSLSRCRGMLQCIFLSDLVTADGRYLESFVFNPGPLNGSPIIVSHKRVRQKEIGTRGLTSGTIMQLLVGNSKSRLAIGHTQHTGNGWYSSSIDDLHRVEDGIAYNYLPEQSKHRTRSGLAYRLA